MSVTPITGSTTTAAKSAATSTDPLLDKDAFLKLLTAQLKYQDPMSPTDSSTFTTQMSQLSETEQMTNVASDQDKMLASTNNSTALNLLGKTVNYVAGDGSTANGIVNNVDLSGDAPKLTIGATPGVDLASLLTVQ